MRHLLPGRAVKAPKFKRFIILTARRLLKPSVLFNLFLFFYSSITKASRLLNMPFFAFIETSSMCNFTCTMCRRSLFGFERVQKNMTYGEFKEIIDQLEGSLIFLALWNFGEPLLNSEIDTMVAYCSNKRIITSISSNGALLDKDTGIRLIKAGLKYLIISVDATDKRVYEYYRRGGDLEKLKANIMGFCQTKKEMGAKFPIVDLQFIVMSGNEHQSDEFLNLAKAWGADAVSLKRFSTLNSFREAGAFQPKGNNFIDAVRNADRITHGQLCETPWRSIVINADGNVIACCQDYFCNRVLGNAFTDDISRIWNSPPYQELRKSIKGGLNSEKMCRDCPYPEGQEGRLYYSKRF